MSDLTAQNLDRRLYAVLATENDDGTVHLAPVMFPNADGRILIEQPLRPAPDRAHLDTPARRLT